MMEQPGDSRFSYLPATWARLVALKAARDPLNLFRALDYAHPNATYAPPSIHDALFKPFSALAPAPGHGYGMLSPASAPGAAGAPAALHLHG